MATEPPEPDAALLEVAGSVDDPEKIRELLASGADVHYKDPETGATPLAKSCSEGHINNAKILLETSDIESRDKSGRTPLAVAAQQGHLDIIKLLVENKADVDVKTNDGETLLSLASQNGHLKVIKYFQEKGAEVDAKDNTGRY